MTTSTFSPPATRGVLVVAGALHIDRIIDLTSPRYLPEVIRSWVGRLPFHDPKYDALRDLIDAQYVRAFNDRTGHYDRLEASIRKEGIRNPIMLTAGRLERRRMSELPPDVDVSRAIVSEYLGGSRLWVARKLGLWFVPVIVNDHVGLFLSRRFLDNATVGEVASLTVIASREELLARFADRPEVVRFNPGVGAYVNALPYVHIPAGVRYDVAHQSKIRRQILVGVHQLVRSWLREHDG